MNIKLIPATLGFTTLVFSMTAAYAQSSITIYGNVDLAIDRVSKGEGNVQGTIFGLSGTTPVPNSLASPATTNVRLTPSLSSQSYLGFKGVEDLGDGYLAKFVLESGVSLDSGSLTNDGRLFGRQAYVGLATPFGEMRLGRQGSPMLTSFYLTTVERLGTTDLMGAGIIVNNLQTYQDNVISYFARKGPWIGSVSYSPNAGVASAISGARSTPTSAAPAATPATGQILGGASAGAETANRRGHTEGAMLGYIGDGLTITAAFHRNDFSAPVGLPTATGGFIPLYRLKSYTGTVAGAKYVLPNVGTILATNFHIGKISMDGGTNIRTNTTSFGVKQPFGAMSIGAEYFDQRFTNFTNGKENGVMLSLDYDFSKRTTLYSRIGYVKDNRGNVVRGDVTPLPIAGGTAVVLIPFGSTEIPTFSGAGNNMDARTTIVSVGIRHSF